MASKEDEFASRREDFNRHLGRAMAEMEKARTVQSESEGYPHLRNVANELLRAYEAARATSRAQRNYRGKILRWMLTMAQAMAEMTVRIDQGKELQACLECAERIIDAAVEVEILVFGPLHA